PRPAAPPVPPAPGRRTAAAAGCAWSSSGRRSCRPPADRGTTRPPWPRPSPAAPEVPASSSVPLTRREVRPYPAADVRAQRFSGGPCARCGGTRPEYRGSCRNRTPTPTVYSPPQPTGGRGRPGPSRSVSPTAPHAARGEAPQGAGRRNRGGTRWIRGRRETEQPRKPTGRPRAAVEAVGSRNGGRDPAAADLTRTGHGACDAGPPGPRTAPVGAPRARPYHDPG